MIIFRGSNHTSQSDGPFVMPTSMDRNVTTTDIDPSTAHDVNMKLMHAFLLRVLHKGLIYLTRLFIIVL